MQKKLLAHRRRRPKGSGLLYFLLKFLVEKGKSAGNLKGWGARGWSLKGSRPRLRRPFEILRDFTWKIYKMKKAKPGGAEGLPLKNKGAFLAPFFFANHLTQYYKQIGLPKIKAKSIGSRLYGLIYFGAGAPRPPRPSFFSS